MKNIEKILFLLVISFTFIRFLTGYNYSWLDTCIMTTYLLLASIYFPCALFVFGGNWKELRSQKISRIVGIIGIGFAFATNLIGILFVLLSWPNDDMQLSVGIVPSFIGGFIVIIKFFARKDAFYKQFLVRSLFFLTIGFILLILPLRDKTSLLYHQAPEYKEKYIKYYETLNTTKDTVLWNTLLKELQEERQKMK